MLLKKCFRKNHQEHAFLGASNYHWLRYDKQKLIDTFRNKMLAEKGTEIHDLAAKAISLGFGLKDHGSYLEQYVDFCIENKMEPEFFLYFSDNCYGTADAISFDGYTLKICDLKTGVTKVKMDQLEIYAALACLINDVNPEDIIIELRIFQKGCEVQEKVASPSIIFNIMNRIIEYDAIIEEEKARTRR